MALTLTGKRRPNVDNIGVGRPRPPLTNFSPGSHFWPGGPQVLVNPLSSIVIGGMTLVDNQGTYTIFIIPRSFFRYIIRRYRFRHDSPGDMILVQSNLPRSSSNGVDRTPETVGIVSRLTSHVQGRHASGMVNEVATIIISSMALLFLNSRDFWYAKLSRIGYLEDCLGIPKRKSDQVAGKHRSLKQNVYKLSFWWPVSSTCAIFLQFPSFFHRLLVCPAKRGLFMLMP